MCSHRISRPSADDAARGAAHIVSAHPEQGWYLLSDGTVLFDDTGALLPDGSVVAPHRVPAEDLAVAA
ncbi:DUF5999 family protein [Streptomyces minutiscleroticus]|uniref:Uncharacterized protein n=1 Tax=Streptomyces minutiscleroticus TaxID=68238 RepID=A0A918U6Y8_9ACTN|nr:DUF5999 family protein [Streptomyces minutiscleroticus]GGY04903.1 hypothetical protein GCM10010358_67980 [Streptomyces minutiscleroticus]